MFSSRVIVGLGEVPGVPYALPAPISFRGLGSAPFRSWTRFIRAITALSPWGGRRARPQRMETVEQSRGFFSRRVARRRASALPGRSAATFGIARALRRARGSRRMCPGSRLGSDDDALIEQIVRRVLRECARSDVCLPRRNFCISVVGGSPIRKPPTEAFALNANSARESAGNACITRSPRRGDRARASLASKSVHRSANFPSAVSLNRRNHNARA